MPIVLSSTTSSGLGIVNYGELKERVALWLNRTDLTDNLPDFVRLAETDIRRDVRTRPQEQIEAGTMTGATFAVPALLIEARRLLVGGKKVDYLTPEQWQDRSEAGAVTGNYYTIIGEAFYPVGGAADVAYSLLYWQGYVAFANDTDQNWLLLNAPGVYLFGACAYGAEYLKDFEAASRFRAEYDRQVAAINASEAQMRYSGSRLTIKAS